MSKPQAGLPSLQHQSPKSTQIASSCEKHRVSPCQRLMAGDTKSCLKGQGINFHMQPLTLGSGKGGGGRSGLVMLEERLGAVALGRELREQLPGSQC